jgi:hypothetical protein
VQLALGEPVVGGTELVRLLLEEPVPKGLSLWSGVINMPVPYAVIQNGAVVNTQMINPGTDVMDPTLTWVPISGLACQDGSPIQIGCTYDGTSFYAAQ